MPRPPALDPLELRERMLSFPSWTLEDGKLHRTFDFTSFSAAIGFMVQVAFRCEQLDHHPNWTNVYKTVRVELWTHDVGGVTALDLELAQAMDAIARG